MISLITKLLCDLSYYGNCTNKHFRSLDLNFLSSVYNNIDIICISSVSKQRAVRYPFTLSATDHLMHFRWCSISPSHFVDGPPDLPLTDSAEVMHIEMLSTLLTSGLYHLISLGSAKRWTLCFGIYKINPINGIFAQEGVEFRVYGKVSNPIKSGFAFLYDAQHCSGSYGLRSCQTGTNYK